METNAYLKGRKKKKQKYVKEINKKMRKEIYMKGNTEEEKISTNR